MVNVFLYICTMKKINNNNDSIEGFNILLFATSSCNPCKNMKFILEDLEKSHSDKVAFFIVDINENTKLAKSYNIKSVPTTVFRKGNTIKDRFAGFIDTIDLENKLMNLLFDFSNESDDFMDFNL